MRNKRILLSLLLMVLLINVISPIVAFAGDGVFDEFNVTYDGNKLDPGISQDGGAGWKGIIIRYRKFIVGIAGVAAVTMVLLFIFQFIKLGQSAGNPQARAQALTGVMWTGVAAAGLGAVAIITSLFYGAIKNQ
jgi:hypothetical protein